MTYIRNYNSEIWRFWCGCREGTRLYFAVSENYSNFAANVDLTAGTQDIEAYQKKALC